MATPTSKANLDKINKYFDNEVDMIAYLYCRWLDESEYEDLEDYKDVIQKRMPKGFEIVKMSKRPFGFHFSIGTDAEYQISCTKAQIKWKRIK